MKLRFTPFDLLCLIVSAAVTGFLLRTCDLPVGKRGAGEGPAEAKPQVPALEETTERAYLAAVEAEILRLTNAFRRRKGLPGLELDAELAAVARAHSEDMLSRNFYGHKNPEGLDAPDRIEAALADRYYLAGSAENIAFCGSNGEIFSGMSSKKLGDRYTQGWIDSPPHRKNLLNPKMTHIGIGVSRSRTVDRSYGTQNLMRYLVRKAEPDRSYRASEPVELRFRSNPAAVARDSLVVRVGLPDPEAPWYLEDGRFYKGAAFPAPRWTGKDEFVVSLPITEYGPGAYRLRFGDGGGNRALLREFEYLVR